MSNLLSPESPLMGFLEKIADLLILNILWFFFSIPIVTIGTSTTAVYRVAFKLFQGENVAVFRTFWGEFKDSFKQTVLIWIPMLVILILLVFDLHLVVEVFLLSSTIKMFMISGLLFASFIWLGMFIYVFAVQAQFANTIKGTLRNSFIFMFSYLPHTIFMLAFDVLVVYLCFRFSPLFVFSAPILVNAFVLGRIFKKHM